MQVGSGLIGQNGATFKVQLDFPELGETSPVAGAVSCFALNCRRPALFQALSLEVYATVRLGRAPLLGRSRSTERVCPCVCFRVNHRQD